MDRPEYLLHILVSGQNIAMPCSCIVSAHLVDSHPAAHASNSLTTVFPRSVPSVWHHFRHCPVCQFFFLRLQLSACNVWFQALSEVGGAHAGVDDCHYDQDDGDDGEGGERAADGFVLMVSFTVLVHSDELEEEVCEASDV